MRPETWRRVVRRGGAALALAGAALLVAGCGETTTGPENGVPASVTITPETAVLESVGQEVAFEARVFDAAGRALSDVALTWDTSDPDVLEPVGAGVFRSARTGTATIRARVSDGPEAEALVTVEQRPAGLRLNAGTVRFHALGQSYPLEAEVVDPLGTPLLEQPAIQWSVEPGGEAVAGVDATGLAHALADGTARVTATAGGMSASADVDVAAIVRFEACFSFVMDGDDGEPQSAGDCAAAEAKVRVTAAPPAAG